MYSIWTKCTLLIFLYITVADGHPVQDTKPNNDENCIKMSPDIQKQLNNIIEEITKQINAISAEYDAVDLRLIEISVDRHFPEENQKNTIVQLTVNDCTNGVNQNQHYTDDIKHQTNSVVQKDISNTSNKSLENDNDFENFDTEIDDGNDSNSGKLNSGSGNGKVISEVSPEENDFNKDDLFIDDINSENTKKPETEVDDVVIDEFDADFDDFDDRETNITSQINVKNDIPVKLNLIDFNDIKHTKFDKEFININTISKEINLIDNDDKIFFRAMKKVRGDSPFVIYERCVQGSVQYWFF